jgi:hypothetical protein
MLSALPALLVLTVVVIAMAIRDATQYSPDSRARLWATRVAVFTIILWFTTGLLHEIAVRHGALSLFLSRGFGRSILAIFLVWLVFRDEL